MEFSANLPIYLQLMEYCKGNIISGAWEPGGRIPAVRELSAQLGVNPNTMQRALAELERDELLFSNRTAGRFVTDHAEKIQQLREDYARRQLQLVCRRLLPMGYTREQLAQMIMEVETDG